MIDTTSSSVTIFFVAFEFPPLGGIGVQRSAKFAKYLQEFGVNPIVITPRESDFASIMPDLPIDKSLLNDFPKTLTVERVACLDPSAGKKKGKFVKWKSIFFSTVERHGKWWRGGLDKALPELVKRYDPKLIYVSIPPFAMAPLWVELSKKYNLPIIIDFRDAWSQWCISPHASFVHYKLKMSLERSVLASADRVIFTSNQTLRDIVKVHPSITPSKYTVIRNGYDQELFDSDQIEVIPKDRMIIGYVGSFYYTPEARDQVFRPWWKKPVHRMIQYVHKKEDWLYRSPYFFFRAVNQLLASHPELKEKIEIHFAGKEPQWLKEQVKEFGLQNIYRHLGYLSHKDSIAFQQSCDMLLITSSKVANGRDYSVAGKTFEYFAIGKPILSFVCEGEQKDILEESRMAIICDPDDTTTSASKMWKFFTERTVLLPNKSALARYNRKATTSELASLIRSALS